MHVLSATGHVTAVADQINGNPWRAAATTSYDNFLSEFGTTAAGKTPLEHDKYCLAMAFTALDFNDGVLGLAWLGK